MSDALWAHRDPPDAAPGDSVVWQAVTRTPAELTEHRSVLRHIVQAHGSLTRAGDDDVDRSLLAFEELGSYGLRHAGPPVEIKVARTPVGWLVVVADAAVDRPPTPAVGRDAAEGGLGLYLVARLSAAHGWGVQEGRKRVWACIDIV